MPAATSEKFQHGKVPVPTFLTTAIWARCARPLRWGLLAPYGERTGAEG
jgi:hypothetical protein